MAETLADAELDPDSGLSRLTKFIRSGPLPPTRPAHSQAYLEAGYAAVGLDEFARSGGGRRPCGAAGLHPRATRVLLVRLDQAEASSLDRGGCAGRLGQLSEDVRDVPVHGVLAEHEGRRDLAIRHAGRDEAQDLGLA
jgi:hypothetical protein